MIFFRNTFVNGALWISIAYYMLAYFFAPADQGVTITGVFVFGAVLLVTEIYDWFWGRRSRGE